MIRLRKIISLQLLHSYELKIISETFKLFCKKYLTIFLEKNDALKEQGNGKPNTVNGKIQKFFIVINFL